jgi:transcriptional regulator with GAF, ATPase, and Fis domain
MPLRGDARGRPPSEASLSRLREEEERVIARALERCGGKVYGKDGAAALLGLPPTTLQSKLKKLGLR